MLHKNIVFLAISMNKGGAERVISILLKHLDKIEGINVYLIMMEDGITYELPENIKPYILHSGKKSAVRKLFELPIIAYKIAKFSKVNSIDTIVSFLYRPNYINILTHFFGFRGKKIINIRSTTSRYLNEGLLGRINLFLVSTLFNKSDLIISNSNGVKNDLEDLMEVKTRHISIPNPIDIKQVNHLISQKGVKEIDEQLKYIISVGRLIPLKRHKDLILSFSNIYTKLPNVKLLFLGDGELMEELVEYAKSLGIKDIVVFLGNVDNPFYYLDKSELFVMTSEIEGFPNVLIEAMACGLPVISSDCKSGPSEILEDKFGLLFKVGDTEHLSKHILEVMRNKELRETLKFKSLERAKEYNIDKIIKIFEKEILL